MIVDALRPADDASYEAQLARSPMSDADAALAAEMIGRPLRGRSAVAVRCRWGLPAVLRVAPRLDDGTPFPTLFWLSCPLANRGVGRLEASGVMAELTARLDRDMALAQQYRAAHDRYVAARNALGPAVPGDPSAGGMPGRVKCLHALYGHHLATRDNPIGAWVAEQIEPMPCPAPCVGPMAPDQRQRAGGWGAEGEGERQRAGGWGSEHGRGA
jgi:uncharacterized protein